MNFLSMGYVQDLYALICRVCNISTLMFYTTMSCYLCYGAFVIMLLQVLYFLLIHASLSNFKVKKGE